MSNSPTTAAFLSPYQIGKILSGVLPANQVKRPLWFSKFFGMVDRTTYPTVNFDQQYIQKNVMGTFVSPNADVPPIQIGEFGTEEMYFAYSKEGLNSADYEELAQRQLGQQFGQVDVLANDALILQKKLMLAEQRFENLFEKTARDIFVYGGYSAKTQQHKDLKYNFNRVVVTTGGELQKGIGGATNLVPAVNLTTSPVYRPWDWTSANTASSYAQAAPYMPVVTDPLNTGSSVTGCKAWTKANIDAGTATPVQDLIVAYQTAKFRAGSNDCVMSSDAYAQFSYDIEQNYPAAADNTIAVMLHTQRDILPRLVDIQGLTLKRVWAFENGETVNIYIYDGVYATRDNEYDQYGNVVLAGTNTKYMPDGWMLLLPDASYGITIYGRIMHPRAQYAALPRWMNYWEVPKTGKKEWEIHTSFVMGTTEMPSTIAWKVK